MEIFPPNIPLCLPSSLLFTASITKAQKQLAKDESACICWQWHHPRLQNQSPCCYSHGGAHKNFVHWTVQNFQFESSLIFSV